MTEPTEPSEPSEPVAGEGEVVDDERLELDRSAQPRVSDREPGWFVAIDRWRGIGELSLGFAIGIVIVWFFCFSHLVVRPNSDWVVGAGAFAAVAVVLWQANRIQRQAQEVQRQAKDDAHEAAERLARELAAAQEGLRREFAAAQEGLRREFAAAEARSAGELAHARELHRVELDAQKELARIQRVHLLELQQKQALAEVSRAVSAHTHMLATLQNQGAKILAIQDRAERELAMDAIMEQLGRVVQDFLVELGNAHLLIEDDRVHEALDRVNAVALKAVGVAEDVRVAVVEGYEPDPNPIPPVQELMQTRAADARNLAAELLRTGNED
jgi:hypothetical protein